LSAAHVFSLRILSDGNLISVSYSVITTTQFVRQNNKESVK